MSLFILIALLILGLIYGFSGYRMIRPLPFGPKWKAFLWVLLISCLGSLILAVTARYRLPGHWFSPYLTWGAYACFGFMTLLFPTLLFKDAGLIVYSFFCRLFVKQRKKDASCSSAALQSRELSRRSFLTNTGNAALTAAVAAVTGYGIVRMAKGPDVVKVDIPVINLPKPFWGFTILQISDLHISLTIKEKFVRDVVTKAGREPVDMIVFTGDLADGHVKDIGGDAAPLADLWAPCGKYFVTGNHDYYSGVMPWLARIERLGFTPLINAHRIIEKKGARMVLAGITDYRAGRIRPGHTSNPAKALKGAPATIPRIMLAHQPKSIFQVAPLGVDLMISGHTHGGQYLPYNLMVPLDQPYVHGLHRHNRRTQIYVSRGTGYWGPPMRIGAPPEITIIRLVQGTRSVDRPLRNTEC